MSWEAGQTEIRPPSMPHTLATIKDVKSRKWFHLGCTNNRAPGKTVSVPRVLKVPHAKTFTAALFSTVKYGKTGDLATGKWLRTFYINSDIFTAIKNSAYTESGIIRKNATL